MSDEAKRLQNILDMYKENNSSEEEIAEQLDEIKSYLESEDTDYYEYNDLLVRQLIRMIKVDGTTLKILFTCGLEYEQRVYPKIKQ